MAKDYYAVLGVDKSASEAEIKSAYRKKAREWHPDVAKDKPDAETKFKEINEAYQILGDKTKKSHYDQFGTAPNEQPGYSGGNPFGGAGGNYGPFSWSYSSDGGFGGAA
ncbi:MAG: molecular chaperone DnaJ, partial [Patescibacteria group bacterium]|nr:molecular chaperone DnaJ [Patescibacteria group bacterium]